MRRFRCHPMRLLTFGLLVPALLGCLAWGAAARVRADNNRASRQQLLQMEVAYVRAYNGRDRAALDRMLTEDFLITLPDGTTIGKPDFIDQVVGREAGTTGETTVYFIRTYGDCGVVVADFVTRWNGQFVALDRFTDACVRRGGRWYFYANQDSVIPPG